MVTLKNIIFTIHLTRKNTEIEYKPENPNFFVKLLRSGITEYPLGRYAYARRSFLIFLLVESEPPHSVKMNAYTFLKWCITFDLNNIHVCSKHNWLNDKIID